MSTLDPILTHLAREQHGMLTTQQLASTGLASADIARLVKLRVLRHPGRGLYAVASQSSDDPVEWHRQLVAGAFLLYPDAVLTGASALLALGLPTWKTDLSKPELLRPRDRWAGMSAFRVRPARGEQQVIAGPWGTCVPLADALVQHAIDAGITQGVVSCDHALREGLVISDELEEAVERVKSWPKSSRPRAMLTLADGRRESVGESRSGLIFSFYGIEVVPQVTIRDHNGEFVARVDFLVKGTRVVIEFDGKIKYERDPGLTVFAEKNREDRLRELGYTVVRVIWRELNSPAALVARIHRAIALDARQSA